MPTILVVADQPDTRKTLCQIYLHGGFVVLEAKDSETAFDLAQENPFDMVMLGLEPTESSLQICSRFAAEYKAPILYLTSINAIDVVLNAGASDVIITPNPRLLTYRTQLLLEARESAAQKLLAEALRDAAAVLNSTLEVEVVLDRLLALIHDVIPSDLSTM